MKHSEVTELFENHVLQTYGRFPLTFVKGKGQHLWDSEGKRYLDMGGGIAVNILGHAHPDLQKALSEQAQTLWHCSNLYQHPLQGELAEALVHRIGDGKIFFSNSGAESNEGLYKLARRYGHSEGRHEIITFKQSFHGRTLAGIAATGQEKVQEGFGPLVSGFQHAVFNDLRSVEERISPSTVAVMLEGIQGEGGIHPATPEFLLGLRELCDTHQLLLLWDGVQCGHYRTGFFQSFQSLLHHQEADTSFLPDAISMAKSLGGGFPIGAFWVRQPFSTLLGPGSHGTTYGGNPLACSVASRILQLIQEQSLDQNALKMGSRLQEGLHKLQLQFPDKIDEVRGMGLMLGIVLRNDGATDSAPSMALVKSLHQEGMLTIPSGTHVVRFLPALNIQPHEVDEALHLLEHTLSKH